MEVRSGAAAVTRSARRSGAGPGRGVGLSQVAPVEECWKSLLPMTPEERNPSRREALSERFLPDSPQPSDVIGMGGLRVLAEFFLTLERLMTDGTLMVGCGRIVASHRY